MAFRLSKAGYGTPEQILALPADMVLEMLNYEDFLNDYERAFVELNKKS